MKTKIIAGFPGVGKTTYTNTHANALDVGCEPFSRGNKAWPSDYLRFISVAFHQKKYSEILISMHKIVIDYLKYDFDFTVVYPHIDLKEEYLERYKSRGNNQGFIGRMSYNWDEWITEIQKETYEKIRLTNGQFLDESVVAKCLST